VPHIDEVPGQAARDEEKGVDTDVIAFASVAGRQPFRGDRDPTQAIFVERPSRRIFGSALLYFDKGQRTTAAGDEVDFSARHARAAG
jgi:hypothetical protein